MSNSNKKKNKPAAGKSAAGKTNLKNNNQKLKQKQRAEAEKRAKRIIEEKQKAQKLRQKKSEEIHKRREKEQKEKDRIENKISQKRKRKNKRKKIVKKIKYLTSKEFLSSINYFRVFVFIVLPIVLVVFGVIGISRTVLLNVPSEIRSFSYEGRIESETVAQPSAFNRQQQQVFADTLKAKGSGKFDFYINSVISVNDNATDNLCFGNPQGNKYVLIATIYDKDGTVIYRSLGLEEGKEINSARMFTELPYGLNDVKVAVNAYDKETNEKIGTKYAAIKLAVGVDENGK